MKSASVGESQILYVRKSCGVVHSMVTEMSRPDVFPQ